MPDFATLFSSIQNGLQILSYASVVLAVAPLFPFLYIVLRWRAPNEATGPGLGTLGAIHYFLVLSLLLFVAGAANLTYGWVSETPVDPETTRYSWAMFTGSLLFFWINFGLLRFVRDRIDLPNVRRLFAGFFMVMTGLTAFVVMLFFFVAWFQKADPEIENSAVERLDAMRLYASWIIYFLPCYVGTTVLMARTSRASAMSEDC